MFRVINRYDGTLMWLNAFFLMAVVLIPFSSRVLSAYRSEEEGVAFYALSLLMTGLLLTTVWLYASTRHRLIAPEVSPQVVRRVTEHSLTPSLIFLPSLPMALFVSTDIAIAMWVVALPVTSVFRYIEQRFD